MSDPVVTFPHHRLHAWCVSLEFAVAVRRLAQRMPRGHASLADQMVRAAQSASLLIAEGANRRSPGDKRYRFEMAQGEVGECAAALELAVVLGLVPDADARTAMALAARIAAMLTRLVQRFA